MLDKFLPVGMGSDQTCEHAIDPKALPEWNKRIGNIYKCTKCGAKVFKEKFHVPKPGERVRRSKKERRRMKIDFSQGYDE